MIFKGKTRSRASCYISYYFSEVMLCCTFILVVRVMISYLVGEHGRQHGVVGRRNDEVVVEVVVTVRLDHLTQVRLDLEVTPKAFFVFRNAVALWSYTIWCSSLEYLFKAHQIMNFFQLNKYVTCI